MKTGKIVTGLLALLGFAGCEKGGDGNEDDLILMYGILRVGFEVKGRVTDAADKPLENIRVVLKLRDDETDGDPDRLKSLRDTVYTDVDGRFETDRRSHTSLPWAVIASDVDGAENGGEFESVEKQFIMDKENVYVREINFKLTEKEHDNENE